MRSRTAVEILLKHFAGQPVESLDSRSFLLLQELFVAHRVSRQYCNALMGYIRAMLKWGVIRKLVSHHVYGEAKFVPALKRGKPAPRKNQDGKMSPTGSLTEPFLTCSLP